MNVPIFLGMFASLLPLAVAAGVVERDAADVSAATRRMPATAQCPLHEDCATPDDCTAVLLAEAAARGYGDGFTGDGRPEVTR